VTLSTMEDLLSEENLLIAERMNRLPDRQGQLK
jgi:hypothetical protein